MESAMSRLQVKLESVDWERLGVQTQQSVERAMEQMRRNMDRMVEKAARQQEKLERKVERERQRQEWADRRLRSEGEAEVMSGEAYEPIEPEPDLEEERLSILRMVEQGQISPGEAEMLLDALE
jgi:exonuclease VII large subunit